MVSEGIRYNQAMSQQLYIFRGNIIFAQFEVILRVRTPFLNSRLAGLICNSKHITFPFLSVDTNDDSAV